jgi:hypothetical protein
MTAIESELVIELSQLVKDNAPNIAANADRLKMAEVLSGTTDGTYYFLPVQTGSEGAPGTPYHSLFLTRWDLYKQLGSPEITNLDEYLDMLIEMQKLEPKTADGKTVYAYSLEWDSIRKVIWPWHYTYGYYTSNDFINTNINTGEMVYEPLDEDSPFWNILEYYNTAVNKAVDAKVGFNKVRYVDNEKLNAGILLKTFGDVMYQFMGIGAENRYTMDVTKGQWESDLPHQYLRKSTLSESDITKATCTENGEEYTIVFNVKGGNSYADKKSKSNNSPIDKCGICVGDGDKSYFDHKTAVVIYDAIDDILGGAKVSESYDNATVKAVINSTTGNLVSLTVEYNIDVEIDVAGGGNATGSAHIFYKNFKY